MPKHELNNDDANGHVKVGGEKPMRPQLYTKNYRQLRKLGEGKMCSPRRVHQMIMWCQMVRPEIMRAGHIIYTEKVILRNIKYMYVCMQ